MPLNEFVQYKLETGSPITIEETTLTPQSQVLSVRWPNGGWVWNRPVAILAEKDGESQRHAIIDVTRYAQFGLIGVAFFFAILALVAKLTRKRR